MIRRCSSRNRSSSRWARPGKSRATSAGDVGQRAGAIGLEELRAEAFERLGLGARAQDRVEVEPAEVQDHEPGLGLVARPQRADAQAADGQVAAAPAPDLRIDRLQLEREHPPPRLAAAVSVDQADRVVRQHAIEVDHAGPDELLPHAPAIAMPRARCSAPPRAPPRTPSSKSRWNCLARCIARAAYCRHCTVSIPLSSSWNQPHDVNINIASCCISSRRRASVTCDGVEVGMAVLRQEACRSPRPGRAARMTWI